MVNVKKNVKDINAYTWETVWFGLKKLNIIGIVFVPVVFTLLFLGIFVNKNVFTYLPLAFFILLIFVLIYIRMYFYYKKCLKSYFKDANSDGDIELTISYNDNEYRIENLSNKTVAAIKKADIKTVKVMKKAVFIKTAMNEMIFFPKTAEVLELFDGK